MVNTALDRERTGHEHEVDDGPVRTCSLSPKTGLTVGPYHQPPPSICLLPTVPHNVDRKVQRLNRN